MLLCSQILPCTMESCKDHPSLETWQTPQRTYVLQAYKPFTHSIQVYEKLLLHHLFPIIENRRLLPDRQFGFRQRHSTIHQTHPIVHKINEALETKQYCSTAFQDISQAFYRVWHTGFLHKLRQFLPLTYYRILKSYLHNRHFQAKVKDSYTDLLPVNAGVSQGSVLGPLLYLLYTADLPTSPDSTIATFADDTVILATDPDPVIASQKLQTSLLTNQHWLTKWRLKANSSKSTHVTFTTRRATCPGVHIYNEQLSQAEEVKYPWLHLDRRLTWHKHIFSKRKYLGITLSKMCWLLGCRSKLSISNKLLACKIILKPIWTSKYWNTSKGKSCA
jgi:hypothetical protein